MEFIDFRHTNFNMLMQNRIYRVLLVCSNYDFFILEEDGRIDEQIFNEYTSLSIRFPPVFVQADSEEKALAILSLDKTDLVILMMNVGDSEPFGLAHNIKKKHPGIPVVILTQFSREVSLRLQNEDLSAVDHVFCWLGNADLLLAILKLIEDVLNARHDVLEAGVQAILVVEDSVRYISQILPALYRVIFEQSQNFAQEGLNEHQKMLRMRGRPKILLAKTFDEAYNLYIKYADHLLGIISDVSFKKGIGGKNETPEGIELCRLVKKDDPNMPFLLQSSDIENEKIALQLNAGFVHKMSKTLNHDLASYVSNNFGFGHLVIKDPDNGTELYRVKDLADLQHYILEIPDDALRYHAGRNEISKWLNARGLFAIGRLFKILQIEDFESTNEARKYIYNAIAQYRLSKGRGIIASFEKEYFDEYLSFSRIGEGSLGGKARGLAFIDSFIQKYQLSKKYPGVNICIPKSVVISTSFFDEFMESNGLYPVALSEISDDALVDVFVSAPLPEKLTENLICLLENINKPLAIRSSSKLEDSLYQPFAGIYNTYMIALQENQLEQNLKMVSEAIKCVYASVFCSSGKAYINATSNVIDEEKMGVIIQEVCGKRFDNLFYPLLSGVARSLDFYSLPPGKPEDGVALIAYGLGRYIVEGGSALRFSPKFPKKVLQLSSPEMALKETQKYFYALNIDPSLWKPSTDDTINLVRLNIREAAGHSSLQLAASSYDHENNIISEDWEAGPKKVISFYRFLQYNSFPLSSVLNDILAIGAKEMNCPVEIEFAVEMDANGPKVNFYLLQIRPIAANEKTLSVHITDIEKDSSLVYSPKALGNGMVLNVKDFVYVKPEAFKSVLTKEIASEVEKVNRAMQEEKRNYILCGPGRWGSADPFLGVPVNWAQISESRVIIEYGLQEYHIDPSQGSHFFHNLTAFKIAYFTVNPYLKEGLIDFEKLSIMPAILETKFLRWVRFSNELNIKVDGRKNEGVIY